MGLQSSALFRCTALLFAMLLGGQCLWLSIAELSRSTIERLPTDAHSAAAAATQRDAAARAASNGAIRGDLWADSAFTYADLLWADVDTAKGHTQALTRARTSLERSLDEAPHNSAAWLLLAGLCSRYPSVGFDTIKVLKMSYYTGSSDQELIPLRLRIAAQSEFVSDFEMRHFVARDLRLLTRQQQKSTIEAAYDAASSAGKHFIEQTVTEIDPFGLDWLRRGAWPHSLPD